MENIMSRLIRISQSLLLTATLIAASAGAGVYYKWEKDGITQYTKEKPRDVPFEEVRTLGGKGIGPSSAPAAAVPASQNQPGNATVSRHRAHEGRIRQRNGYGRQTTGKPVAKSAGSHQDQLLMAAISATNAGLAPAFLFGQCCQTALNQ